MVKNIFDKPQEGDKLYQQRARRALPLLVRQATAEKPIRYEDLALELGMRPRNLDYVLGCIGETLIILSKGSKIEIPPIQCLVINKTTGLPGEGFGKSVNELEDLSNCKQLSNKKRKDKIDKYLESVYSFGKDKWKKEVLDKLELSEAKSDPDLAKLHKKITSKGRGGGEGKEHKKLKEYVANNPAEFGLPKSTKLGKQEYSLPSGDSLDVFFIRRRGHIEEHIGVEVKSHISGTADVLRGVYQCVKYQAVLEAKQVADGEAPNVRTFLVLGGKFPKELMPIKNTLGVEVYDEKNKDIVNISV